MTLHSTAPYERGLSLSAKGLHGEAIACFEQALAQSPDDPRVLFALGNTARDLGLGAAAEEFFNRVLALAPGQIEAQVNLANLLRAEGKPQEAIALLERALGRHPQAPEIRLSLGSAWREWGHAEEAEEYFRAALALDPDYVPVLGNLADILADRGEVEEALSLYARALARDPGNAQLRLNRAILHLLTGNLKQGWRDYAARLDLKGKAPQTDHGLPRWSGGSLKDQCLLVTAEQGVGDHLMFASMIPDLAEKARSEGGRLILDCDARLVPLFARSFPGVTVQAQRLETRNGRVFARYDGLKDATCASEMGSLPLYLRSTLSDFPDRAAYLIPDGAEKARWRARFTHGGMGPVFGICWRSGKQTGGRALQYAPLGHWAALLRELPGTIVCAQYDATAEECAELSLLSGREVLLPESIDQKQELDRACALLCAMDVVITAPTAVSWLSAGVGVPACKILYDTSWTSFGMDYEPFAPQALCMTPDRAGDWNSAFAKALGFIRARFAMG